MVIEDTYIAEIGEVLRVSARCVSGVKRHPNNEK